MKTIAIPTDIIRTLAPLASKEEQRPILNGILFGADGVAVATSGAVLGAYRLDPDATPDADIILPAVELLKLAKASKSFPVILAPAVGIPTETTAFLVGYPGQQTVLHAIAGPYPYWRNVLPSGELKPLSGICFDPQLLKLFPGETAALRFRHAERAIAVLTSNPDFYGIIMPKREIDIVGLASFGWLYPQAKAEAAA